MTQDRQPSTLPQSCKFVFTVFTATYNRAHTLHRVYESLKAQTYLDFEWLIVDDGSTDDTRQLVEQWQQEAEFPIRYIYQENSGKHIAFNRGVREANGELFLNFDSDDSCVNEALERFKYHWDKIQIDQKGNFSAVTCLCKYENGKIVGDRFPSNYTDSDPLEMSYRFKIKGEKWGFHRTNVLRQFPFPKISDQRVVPENVVWYQIARKYKMRLVNEPLRIYFEGADQLTKTGSAKIHALGLAFYHKEVLNTNLDYFRFAPIEFLRSAVHYSRFSFHLQTNLFNQFMSIHPALGKILWVIALPLGYIVYFKDSKQE